MGISITRETDFMDVAPVVIGCFADIVEEGTDLNALKGYVDVENECWLRAEKNGKLLGFIQLKPYNKSALEIHPFIIKKHRRYSEKIIGAVWSFFEYNVPECYKSLITNIPKCKRHAIILALRMAFKHTGTFKQAFEGQHDMLLFQRLRGE